MTDPFAPPSSDAPNPWASPGEWTPDPWQQGTYQPSQAPRTNRLAVAALVVGVLGLVPLAVGLAWGALSQIWRRDEDGAGLALGAIAASALWTLIGALVSLAVIASLGPEGHLRDVPSRTVGACLDGHPRQVTDCSSPHDLEVFYAGRLPDEAWPGDKAVEDNADDRCYVEFLDYVGGNYDDSDYDYSFFVPDSREWAAGERTVVCVIVPFVDDELVGSAKDSGG